MNKLTIISRDTGDWFEVIKDGKIEFEGSSIPSHVFINIIKGMGCNVEEIEFNGWCMYYKDFVGNITECSLHKATHENNDCQICNNIEYKYEEINNG